MEFNGRINYSNVDSVYLKPESEISVYPNPTTGYINILGSYGKSITSIQIYDIMGKELKFKMISKDIIDITILSRGIYFLKIEYDNKVFIDKIFVDRK